MTLHKKPELAPWALASLVAPTLSILAHMDERSRGVQPSTALSVTLTDRRADHLLHLSSHGFSDIETFPAGINAGRCDMLQVSRCSCAGENKCREIVIKALISPLPSEAVASEMY